MPKTPKQKSQNLEYYRRNRERNIIWQRAYRKRVKDACFGAYGGYMCICCGECHEKFLTLDHVNNDGAAHRKATGYKGGIGMYLWIIRNDFPPMFQVLCFNCNHGKQLNGGICPHKDNERNG